jgi:hypothetical protein
MKQIIAIFLFVVAMASCQPKCDCVNCAEQCQVTSTVDQVEAPVTTDTLVQETKEEVVK